MNLIYGNKNIVLFECKSFFDRLKGFMFTKNINNAFLFDKCNSIHTFFMKESIDIVGLDKNMVVREVYFNVSPNKIIFLRKSKHTLELPKFGAKNYKIGDFLKI